MAIYFPSSPTVGQTYTYGADLSPYAGGVVTNGNFLQFC